MNYEISQERKAFLTRDYNRGFIEYFQFKTVGQKDKYFKALITLWR
jgi:hypothetical protein